MSDEIIKEVIDNYKEHELHMTAPDQNCSECFKRLLTHEHTEDGCCEVCELFANVDQK